MPSLAGAPTTRCYFMSGLRVSLRDCLPRKLISCSSDSCGILLAVVLVFQTMCVPGARLDSWLPQAQRESEGESSAPQESSKESVASTVVAAEHSRPRRVKGDRLAVCGHAPIHQLQAGGLPRTLPVQRAGEHARRNGTGCPLRC